MDIICPICERNTPDRFQEKHHLIPRGIAKRNKYAKIPDNDETVVVCRSCGDQLHKLFSEKELADNYRTIVAILANEEVQNWVKWIQKKPR